MTLTLQQQAHRLAVHRVVVHHEDAQLGERRRGSGGTRQRREHALGERHDDLGAAAGTRAQSQRSPRRLGQRARQGELDFPAARALRKAERRHQPLLRFDRERRA